MPADEVAALQAAFPLVTIHPLTECVLEWEQAFREARRPWRGAGGVHGPYFLVSNKYDPPRPPAEPGAQHEAVDLGSSAGLA